MSFWQGRGAYCCLILMCLLQTRQARGSEADVTLSADVDRALVAPSDEVMFRITLKTTEAHKDLTIPEYGNNINGFRIVDFGQEGPDADEGRWTKRRWYKLRADISGSYILPALELQYKGDDGALKTLKTSEIFVEIKATEPPAGGGADAKEAASLRDIKPLVPAGYDRTLIFYAVASAVLLAAGLGALYWWWRRRERPSTLHVAAPHEIAMEALEDLRPLLTQKGKDKEFHFGLSHAIRVYCEGSCGFPATDRTVEEIARDIASVSRWSEGARGSFLMILRACDLVKFAEHKPLPGDGNGLLETAFVLVKGTRPLPLEASGPDARMPEAESVI